MVRILIAVTMVAGAWAITADQVGAAAPDTIPVTTDDITVDTANPFLPDDEDLTACIGMLERPGCGSEERGGWRQYAVAIVMGGGLLIVFGRVAWSVRQSRSSQGE